MSTPPSIECATCARLERLRIERAAARGKAAAPAWLDRSRCSTHWQCEHQHDEHQYVDSGQCAKRARWSVIVTDEGAVDVYRYCLSVAMTTDNDQGAQARVLRLCGPHYDEAAALLRHLGADFVSRIE